MLAKSDIDMFPSLQDFVASTSVDTKVFFVIVSQHLKEKAINFCLYFSKNKTLKRKSFESLIPLQRI